MKKKKIALLGMLALNTLTFSNNAIADDVQKIHDKFVQVLSKTNATDSEKCLLVNEYQSLTKKDSYLLNEKLPSTLKKRLIKISQECKIQEISKKQEEDKKKLDPKIEKLRKMLNIISEQVDNSNDKSFSVKDAQEE